MPSGPLPATNNEHLFAKGNFYAKLYPAVGEGTNGFDVGEGASFNPSFSKPRESNEIPFPFCVSLNGSLTSSGRSVPNDPRRVRMSSAFPDFSSSSSALLSASARSTWLRRRCFSAAAAAALPRRATTPEAAAAVRLALTSSRFTSRSFPTYDSDGVERW